MKEKEYYFLKVQTWQNTNSVGRYVANIAETYDHKVVTAEGWKAMIADLERSRRDAVKLYPRARKKLGLRTEVFMDRYGYGEPYCCLSNPEGEIAPAFSIEAKRVRGALPVAAGAEGEDSE